MQNKIPAQTESESSIRILYIADIVGDPGFEITLENIAALKEENRIDLTIANGENAASGKGLTAKIASALFDLGIDVLTSGNHIWNRHKFYDILDQDHRILRPLNYPRGCPGKGSVIIDLDGNRKIGIMNLQGRAFMYSIDCPFRAADGELERMRNQQVSMIIVDVHAEATAEKIALGWYLDGRVSAVIGSHTHVQTADERILNKGTAYITDAGMTGPFDSVIGMDTQISIQRFLTQLPVHYKVARGPCKCCGVIVSLDPVTGKAESIQRFQKFDTA
jgi:metallophosphoesterase (TIGR00282 family)